MLAGGRGGREGHTHIRWLGIRQKKQEDESEGEERTVICNTCLHLRLTLQWMHEGWW